MENDQDYQLILNHITSDEQINSPEDTFEDYKKMAFLFLSHKKKGLFEDEILGRFNRGKTLEEIFSWNMDQFIPGANQERNGKREKTWYDLMSSEVVEVEDSFFDYFFAVKLRHIDLLKIDDYLNYHLEHGFENDKVKFLRFLNLTVRKYNSKLLKPEIVNTINEWIKSSEMELSGTDATQSTKGKLKRVAGDNMTALNLQQTALLIHFMRETKMILRDEYLNQTEAGKAFSALTGYSSGVLRQELKTEKLNLSKENMIALENAVTRLGIAIKNAIPKK